MEVVFKSRNHGLKKLGRHKRKKLCSLVEFIAVKFIRSDVRDQMTINVILDGDLYARQKDFGTSVWEDTNHRGKEFTIELAVDRGFPTVLETIAHEMVHVKQLALGERRPHVRDPHVETFRSRKYDDREIDYWDLPWEIEAYGREKGLVAQWKRTQKN